MRGRERSGTDSDVARRPDPSTEVLRYRRRPGCIWRALYDCGWVGRPGRVTIVLEGSALIVWVALEAESSVDVLAAEIRAAWPELGAIQVAEVQVALDALLDHGVVEVVEGRIDVVERA